MSLFPDDPKKRCGYGSVFSTDWIWKLLYRLKLSRHPKDPFTDNCSWHDGLTDEEYKRKLEMLNIKIDPERLQQGFDEQNRLIAKRTGYEKLGAVYRFITHKFTRFFN